MELKKKIKYNDFILSEVLRILPLHYTLHYFIQLQYDEWQRQFF